MTTIYEALRSDHDIQRELVDRLVKTTGDSEERRTIFEQLKTELTAHAACEERQFYVPLMVEDLTQDKARHSIAEHKEIDDYLEQLEEYEMSGPQWLPTAEKLADRLRHHLEEEEHEVFQLAGKVLSDEESQELAAVYESAMAAERQPA